MVIRRTEAEWEELVERYNNSGQTQAAWCREHGISEKTLGARLRKNTERKQGNKRTVEEWDKLIAEQKNSGQTRSAWCREQGINSDTMTSAEKRKQKREEDTVNTEWVELNYETTSAAPARKKDEGDWRVRIRVGKIDMEVKSYPMEQLAVLIGKLVKEC